MVTSTVHVVVELIVEHPINEDLSETLMPDIGGSILARMHYAEEHTRVVGAKVIREELVKSGD